jgi:hypothetical protein
MINATVAPPMDRKRIVAITILMFTLAGPPIGFLLVLAAAIVAVALVGTSQPIDPWGLLERLPHLVQFTVFGAAFAYLVGGLQALAAGIMMAVYGLWIGKPSYGVAAVVGLITLGVTMLVRMSNSWMENATMALANVGAALICWGIAKRFWTDPS